MWLVQKTALITLISVATRSLPAQPSALHPLWGERYQVRPAGRASLLLRGSTAPSAFPSGPMLPPGHCCCYWDAAGSVSWGSTGEVSQEPAGCPCLTGCA